MSDIKYGKSIYSKLKNKSFDPVWLEGLGHNDILEKIPTYDGGDLL